MYWWNSRIAELRKDTLKARRAVQRCRRRKASSLIEEQYLNIKYLEVSTELRQAIKKSKAEAWNELMQGIYRNSWGKPYLSRKSSPAPSLSPGMSWTEYLKIFFLDQIQRQKERISALQTRVMEFYQTIL
ncbi:hypothetical protein QLX08_009330 [Tetragonisca angustula]|uniref:Uncharacterized protein n=1 Tax=Tetragonisca angustula TaxID=166442 RepID=A0AAW0ZH48_9HYME